MLGQFPKSMKRFSDRNCAKNKEPERLTSPGEVKNAPAQQKEHQRREALARRDQMSDALRARLSLAVVEHADQLVPNPNGQIISAFWPIRSEIDPRPLMSHLRARGAKLALPALLEPDPRIEKRSFEEKYNENKGVKQIIDPDETKITPDKPSRHLAFRLFGQDDDLVSMGFSTFGPPATAAIVDPDLILLPLAAYDGYGNRIGYGGGHYDRALAAMQTRNLNPGRVGLAFSCQEIPNCAVEPHDIRLEAILTEQGLRYFD